MDLVFTDKNTPKLIFLMNFPALGQVDENFFHIYIYSKLKICFNLLSIRNFNIIKLKRISNFTYKFEIIH